MDNLFNKWFLEVFCREPLSHNETDQKIRKAFEAGYYTSGLIHKTKCADCIASLLKLLDHECD